MKKAILLTIVTVLVLSMSCISVFAAGGLTNAVNAKATVDGKIGESEYGKVFTLSDSNVIEFTGTGSKMPYSIDWYFAWQPDALYVGIKVPTDKVADNDVFQLNFNPGDLIVAEENGLFLSMVYAKGAVSCSQYNWATALCGTADATNGAPIKLTTAVGTEGDSTVIEVEVPVDFFKVVQSVNGTTVDSGSYKLGSGDLKCNPFAVLGGLGFAISNAKGVSSGDWTVKGMNYVSITLDGGSSADPAKPTEPPKENNTKTFDIGLVALAAVAISTAAAFKRRK